MPAPPSKYDHEQVIALYASGMTFMEIADKIGGRHNSLRTIVAKKAPHLLRAAGPRPRFDHAEALDLYLSGEENYETLAQRYGVSRSAVQQIVSGKAKGRRPSKRRPSPRAKIKIDELLALKAKGMRNADLARHFGCSPAAISNTFKKLEAKA
ncbi:hypothetical protein HOT99_gp021 [Caulobacter phage CcrBL10]|uniref:Resolvase HTH domain-containing protein n=1 Tax=Caulobacter phage CcrBL10 TaxID=2283269 RepID=A0A385EB70_9CAUD|nr:hypothetical protein HOT99_gp021 [Caulobacter phage CcrBL10]AXQ68225.1 hypothetical protein CcrBL10_gp021 [Caulobacter phage CcrBL10]